MIKIGLYEKLFPKKAVDHVTDSYMQGLTLYNPQFTSYNGGIYEALLCRTAIHSFATHCSKLKIDFAGKNDKGLGNVLKRRPNPWQTTSQFIYRIATLLETDATAFIVPMTDPTGKNIVGFFPVKPKETKVKEYQGEEYLEFTFIGGKKAVIESWRVGVMSKFQYQNDMFGDSDVKKVLDPTLQMIHAQEEGIVDGVKSSAAIRFIATLAGTLKEKTLAEERKRFADFNLNRNGTGVMMFDEKYKDVKQIESKALLIDDKQMAQIKNNIYQFFNINEKILMNDFDEGSWDAYYEGKIEPFAVQLSEVLTNMIYTNHELSFGNQVVVSSNRLEYASNATKLSVVTQLFDRGMMTQNQAHEIFNMKPVGEEGDKYYIRKEYAEVSLLSELQGLELGKEGQNNAN